MRGVQGDGVAQQQCPGLREPCSLSNYEREPAMKWASESQPKDEAKQRKQKAAFFVLKRFQSWPSLLALLIHPRVLWHAGSSSVPFLSTPLCPGWSPPPGRPAHGATPIKINVFPCFWALQRIMPSWLAHIGLRIHRDGPFEACGTCAFLWCKVLTWPHPQTRGNSAYNITLTILYINYIHCLLSITCYKTTYFCRSLIHGNITYSKHKDHVTLITIYLWIPPPPFFPCNNTFLVNSIQ